MLSPIATLENHLLKALSQRKTGKTKPQKEQHEVKITKIVEEV